MLPTGTTRCGDAKFDVIKGDGEAARQRQAALATTRHYY